MSLADLTRPAVLAAVAEFDRLGRDEFLRFTGFKPAVSYFLEYNGRLYDSKAIAGYAQGEVREQRLSPEDFSDDETVARRLRELGFVVSKRGPIDWTRDEIILACALVESNGWRQLGESDPRVEELSELLRRAPIHDPSLRAPNFRNRNSVIRKTADIATRHPNYQGKGTNGNRLDRKVLEEFLDRPEQMRQLAASIRAAIDEGVDPEQVRVPDVDEEGMTVREGVALYRRHLHRERSPKLRAAKLNDARRRGLPIACEVCGFDFAKMYGEHGRDYIECHHRIPLHVTGESKNSLADLALICSNCHRMIHRGNPWLTVEALRELVSQRHQ